VGIGFDTSANIIESAIKLNKDNSNISFNLINGPVLPIEGQTIDLIISLLSFRYLDWDPLMDEIKRVLKPGGKILIIDMVTVPAKWREFPMLINQKLVSISSVLQIPFFIIPYATCYGSRVEEYVKTQSYKIRT